jgi:hypothetical protein
LNDLSHFIVSMSRLNQSQSSLSSLVSSQYNISFLSSYLRIFIRLNNNCMGSKSSESINMNSKLDFYQITFLYSCRIFSQRRIKSANLIDWNSSGESKSLKYWFFIINLGEFFVNLIVCPKTKFENFGADWNFFNESCQNI